jgi:hypothetical protein
MEQRRSTRDPFDLFGVLVENANLYKAETFSACSSGRPDSGLQSRGGTVKAVPPIGRAGIAPSALARVKP